MSPCRCLSRSLAVVAFLLCLFGGAQPQNDTATFYGGYRTLPLNTQDRTLQVSLNFRPLESTGILLIAREVSGDGMEEEEEEGGGGYLLVGLLRGDLLINMKHSGGGILDASYPSIGLELAVWHNLFISLNATSLIVAVGGNEEVLDVSGGAGGMGFAALDLGGTHNFLAPLFVDFNITEYFGGCMANLSVNGRTVNLVESDNEYGIKSGCCPDPTPISWCFETLESTFIFRTHESFIRGSDNIFSVSFGVHAYRNGVLFYSQAASGNSFAIEFHDGALSVVVASGTRGVWRLQCQGTITNTSWHFVSIVVHAVVLSCEVDSTSRNYTFINIDDPRELLATSQIGRALINDTTDIVSQLATPVLNDHLPSFGGCLRRVTLNGAELATREEQHQERGDPPILSDVCSSPEIPSHPETNCSRMSDARLTVRTLAPLMIREGGTASITQSNLLLEFDRAFDSMLFDSVLFTVLTSPTFGHLSTGNGTRISRFTYLQLSTGQVFYQHSGAESGLFDFVFLEVGIECSTIVSPTVNVTLDVSIILINDNPYVMRLRDLSIAVGTRKVIGPDVIIVADSETSDPSEILFYVDSITSADANCSSCEVGRIEKTHQLNNSPRYFSQHEINVGNISFQHFERFGLSPIVIRLRVQDASVGKVDVSINVLPRQGTITLEKDEDCMFVIEGRTAFLTESLLRATTDFEEQNPVLTYYIQHLPTNGKLERRDRRYNTQQIWVTLDGSTESLHSFTQDDINNREVRYAHDNTTDSFLEPDSVQFQIQSTNFTGPSDFLCINIVLIAILIQPELTIESYTPLTVVEGNSSVLTEDTLTVDSSFVDIEDLGVLLTVTSPPLHGSLLLDHTPLEGANFSLVALQAGRVSYQHDDSEDPQDVFKVFAEAQSIGSQPIRPPNRTQELEVTISVFPVNDNSPKFGTPLSPIRVSEGMCVELTLGMLPISDADLPNDSLVIFVRSPRPSQPQLIGHFSFITNKLVATRRFYLHNITERRVVFCNALDASADLTYSQRLRIDDEARHVLRKPEVEIVVVPLSLDVTLSHESGCLGTVDALLTENNAFTLQDSDFNVSLLDLHGNDPSRLLDVNVLVLVPPMFGEITLTVNSTSTPVSQFSCMDVRNNRIRYVFWNQTTVRRDSFTLQFQYGHSSSELSVDACILPIPLLDTARVIQGVTVAQGGLATLNTSNIFANDSRGEQNRIFFNITSPPLFGSVVNVEIDDPEMVVATFTYQELASGVIGYKHTNLEQIDFDSVGLKACTEFGCSDDLTLQITFYVQDLVVINTGCIVNEGEICVLNSTVLFAVAPADYTVTFFFDTNPMKGEIVLSAGGRNTSNPDLIAPTFFEQGKVFYSHFGGEDLLDRFSFTVSAEFSDDIKRESHIFNITVIPKNNHNPEIVNLASVFTVVRGGRRYFTSDLLSAFDRDSYPAIADLRYITHGFPLHGSMHFIDQEEAIDSWLERDIQAGRVYYKPLASVDEDILVVSVTDGERESRREHSRIEIRDVIFRFLTAHVEFSVNEGEAKRISSHFLRYDAENDNTLVDSDFAYRITILPQHGVLMFDGVAVTVGTSFTQDDITNHNLVYAHDHSNTNSDHFSFSLSVPIRQAAGQNYSFEIVVVAVDDDAPMVTHITTPMFVVELGKTIISSDDIVIFDADSVNELDFEAIVCTVVDGPQNGIIQRARFNSSFLTTHEFTKFDLDQSSVSYNHTSADSETDYFMFNISDRFNQQVVTYRVNIVVLPEVIPLTVTSQLYVREGGQVVIGRAEINSTHHYLTRVLGKIDVTRKPRHGILINTLTNESDLDNFTTADLQVRAVRYRHNGDESITDDFQFIYTSLEPPSYPRISATHTLSFDIDPVNDEPPRLSPDREVMLDIWVKQRVTLNQTYFNTVDADTEPHQLNYTFPPYLGTYYIAYAESPSDSINWFTQADVNVGRVLFVHESDPSNVFEYNVTDGHQVVSGRLSIFAVQLVLLCDQDGQQQPLAVDRGSSIPLSTDNLHCITNDFRFTREIFYTFDPPLYGRVMAGVDETTTFTHSQLAAGTLQYLHTDLDQFAAEETLTIHVSTPLAVNITVQLPIAIRYPSSPGSRLTLKASLELVEGGQYCLTGDNLDARNVRYNLWRESGSSFPIQDLFIQFRLDTLPRHGYLSLAGSEVGISPFFFMQDAVLNGTLCYHHDGTESTVDTLPFNVSIVNATDSVLGFIEEELLVAISPINDHSPVLVTAAPNLTLVLGFTYTLTRNDLLVTDNDLPDRISYTVQTVHPNAKILVGGRVLEVHRGGFTQGDIDAGLVQLSPSSLQDGGFSFTFSDGLHNSSNIQFGISVEELWLAVSTNREVTYAQDLDGAVISPELLSTETNGLRGETWFVVVRPPQGTIVGAANPSNFSQSEIDEGSIRYLAPQGFDSSQDVFTVDVYNRNINITGVEVAIKAVVLGSVRQDTSLNFSSSSSLPLSPDLFDLEALQSHSAGVPTIHVTEKPQYGFLELRIVEDGIIISKRLTASEFTFGYDELQLGWVFYTWNPPATILANPDTLEDNFTVLVRASGVQPGEAVVTLTITAPYTTDRPTISSQPTASRTTIAPTGTQQDPSEDGFPLFTLVPILGVFGILILIILIVGVFYYSQRTKFRKKLQPSLSSRANRGQRPSQQSWSPGTAGPLPVGRLNRNDLPQSYEFEATLPSDEEDEMSDAFSQYSEEIIAQNHSPLSHHSNFLFPQQLHRSSPAHSNPPASLPPPLAAPSSLSSYRDPRTAAGVRSNVSITFSHRASPTSQASVVDDPTYFSLPRPVNMAAPIPIRPASHAEFRPHNSAAGKSESGYNSVTRTADTSAFSSRSPSRDAPPPHEAREEDHFPSADIDLPYESHYDEGIYGGREDQEKAEEGGGGRGSPDPEASEACFALASLKLNGLNGSSGLQELPDSELLQMRSYPPPNPVLKKEEYWV